MFTADTKALLKTKVNILSEPLLINYFYCVFFLQIIQISRKLLMDITLDYPLTGQFDI